MADRMRNKSFSLKGLVSPFRRKFRVRAAGTVTALDLDGSLLRVVQTAPRVTRPAVTRIAAERLELAPEADRTDPVVLGKAVARTVDRLRLKPGSVVMGVPRAQVILRTLALPVINDVRELASMVHLQVAKDLPFRLEEAVIDFKVNRRLAPPPPPEPENKESEPAEKSEAVAAAPKLEVLVAATKREVVEFYQQTAEAAGLKLSALGWLSYANARCMDACRVAAGEEVVGLVSLRPDEVGIDLIAQQILLFSRGAVIKLHPPAPPAPEPAPPEAAAPPEPPPAAPVEANLAPAPATYEDAVILEVVRSLHSYGGMEPHTTVAKFVIAGATGHEAAIAEALEKRLNIPSQVLDPAVALDLPKAAREHAAGSISPLGLALGVHDAQGLPFDFLNPKQPAVQRNLQRIRIIIGASAAAALLLLLFSIQAQLVKKREALYNSLKAELDGGAKKRATYRQMRQQATSTQGWIKESNNWLDHYAYLSAILPPSEEIYLTSFSVGVQGTIRLAVQARNGGILAKLDKQLRAAGYDVKPLAVTPGSDKSGYEFRSNVELVVADKMKMDLAKAHPPPRPADDVSLESGTRSTRKGGGL